MALADTVKPEAPRRSRACAAWASTWQLLTGDNQRAAASVAAAVGIEHVRAGVSPSGKLEEIARLQREGHRVGMVGDGVNDAAALAQADLGIAMGTGVGAAIEAADISVLSGDLRGVARALRLARETYTIVLQNLGWAFGYNLIALPLAMTGLLSPALAAVAMGLSSITVVTNSLRLRRFGAPGRPTPVRSRRQRLASIATTARSRRCCSAGSCSPTPTPSPCRAAPRRRSPSRPARRSRSKPCRCGRQRRPASLSRERDQRPAGFRCSRCARSPDRRQAKVTYYTAGTGHDIAEVPLTRGIWDIHIAGADGAGHPLSGSFAIPIN